MKRRTRTNAFTLVELLVVLAIIAILAFLVVPAVSGAMQRSKSVTCFSRMREIGMAIMLYSQDNQGNFPRSSHSAAANREPGWADSIAPYLGMPSSPNESAREWVNNKCSCPCNTKRPKGGYSYGMNVFFELGQGDSYVGRPNTWRRLAQVPSPSRTILLAEEGGTAGGMTPDHFMCHQWSSLSAATNAVAHDRHAGRANYLFVDGHVESLAIGDTFTSKEANLWNPSAAARP